MGIKKTNKILYVVFKLFYKIEFNFNGDRHIVGYPIKDLSYRSFIFFDSRADIIDLIKYNLKLFKLQRGLTDQELWEILHEAKRSK